MSRPLGPSAPLLGPEAMGAETLGILEGWAKGIGAGPKIALRAKAVLGLAAGESARDVAERLGTSQGSDKNWGDAFAAKGPEGLLGGFQRKAMAALAMAPEDDAVLRGWADAPESDPDMAIMARIVLMSAAGESARAVGEALGISGHIVWRCPRKFVLEGITGLSGEKSGPPARPALVLAPEDEAVLRG